LLPFYVLLLTVFLGCAAFSVDFGYIYLTETQLQAVADAEALACARTYGTCKSGADPFPPTNQQSFTVQVTNPVNCPNQSTQLNCVQATSSTTIKTFFLPLFGISSLNLSKTAIAGTRAYADALIIRNQFSANGNNVMQVTTGSVIVGGGISTTNKSGINASQPGATITSYNGIASGCGTCTPAVTVNPAPLPAPPPYTPPASPTVRTVPACVSNLATFSPGTYSSPVTLSCSSNQLTAGIYYFNGGLDTNSQTLSGTGVTLIIGTDQPLSLTGTVTLNSSAGGGTCGTAGQGMLIYQALSSTPQSWSASGSGNNISLTGRVQLPNTDMTFSGSPVTFSMTGSLYVNSLTMHGNLTARASNDPCQNINLGVGSILLVQ
jgi:hypothetical protein